MKNRLDIDTWEEAFSRLCLEKLDEEPLYEYEHLYKKGLSPEQAFMAYIKENPDYLEKLQEILEEQKQREARSLSPEERARREAEQKRRDEAKKRLSQYCPNCARLMAGKKQCKCGYKRGKDEQ